MKLLLLLSFLTAQVFAYDVQLERGEVIFENQIRGRVSYTCNNRPMSYVSCVESYLEGGDYGRLVVINGSIDADYVKLQREGSKYIKGAKFNAQTGKTGVNFNLWLVSAFQRPLLTRETNRINYKFFKQNTLVDEGYFDVEVKNGKDITCRWGVLNYQSHCPNRIDVCRDYFRRNPYCQ